MFKKSELDFFVNVVNQLVNGDSLLLHCVTVTNRYAVVLKRVEVVGDAHRRSDFVLTAVTLAD